MSNMSNMPTQLEPRLLAARKALLDAGQPHVARALDALTDGPRDALLAEVESVDWPELSRLIETYVRKKPTFSPPSDLAPAEYFPARPAPAQAPLYARARARGEQLLRQGAVAAFTVAGGQGTRLGFDAPKGAFPATPVRRLTLFEVFARQLLLVRRKYGKPAPWYVMTSPANDADTRAFFQLHDYFGLDPADVHLFPQDMMPAIDRASGLVLLASPHALALSPNGHGGSLKALWSRGALADMTRRGVSQISYVQVDNPLVRVLDPLFIGLHDLENAQMSSKMVAKAHALERVGVLCKTAGRTVVIEYSDLPESLARQLTPDGALRFNAGSVAIHIIRADFVHALNTAPAGFALPYHRADKKVPCLDPHTGAPLQPKEPNAVKLETFVFDALALCDRSIVLETLREEEFAPIKNASGPGVTDSPETSARLQVDRAARWLEKAGVRVPRKADGSPDAALEILPDSAAEPEDLRAATLPNAIASGATFVI
jgi:UDP-N-acetylglucosamine/UDP-N-acetylgalactosamine diphosphorylase